MCSSAFGIVRMSCSMSINAAVGCTDGHQRAERVQKAHQKKRQQNWKKRNPQNACDTYGATSKRWGQSFAWSFFLRSVEHTGPEAPAIRRKFNLDRFSLQAGEKRTKGRPAPNQRAADRSGIARSSVS